MILVGDWAPKSHSVMTTIHGNLFLGNLEGPVLPRSHVLTAKQKVGPSLYSSDLPSGSADYIFSLANNHTMDFGNSGMEVTINALSQRGMKYCGAGENTLSAREPLIIPYGEISVAIIACCETQFGVARKNQGGVADFGSWIYRAIGDLSEQVDAIIVSVHAGVEESPWPSPFIRDLYRSYIDAGATVVHGHHSHIPQGYEKYQSGIIFYGMGNFAVDPDRWRGIKNGLWSLGAEIDLTSRPVQWQPITYEIRHEIGSKMICIEESSYEERESHQQYLEICNYPLFNDVLFEALWQEVAVRAYYAYGAPYMDIHITQKTRRSKLLIESISKAKKALFYSIGSNHADMRKLLLYYHMMACESHRQMLITALGILAGEIRDMRTEESFRLANQMTPWSKIPGYAEDDR